MFKNLFNLGYKRNFIEAIGFYIVYVFLFVLIISLVNGVITNILYPEIKSSSFQEAYERGKLVAKYCVPILLLIASAILSISILVCKKLYNIGAILLALVTICMTSLFGSVLGIIPMSILTTFDSNRNKEFNTLS